MTNDSDIPTAKENGYTDSAMPMTWTFEVGKALLYVRTNKLSLFKDFQKKGNS